MTKKTLAEQAHSFLSPSGAHRWAHCTASANYINSLKEKGQIPEDETSEFAEEGTAAHLVASKILKGRDWYDHDHFNTPVEEEHLPVYVDYINDVTLANPGIKWTFEKRVNPARFVKTNHCKGTADAIGILPDKALYVIDLKFGENVVVETEDNLQAILYALGAIAKLIKQGHNVRKLKIVITIVQPRAWHKDGPIREWVVTYRELKRWGTWLAKRAAEALGPNGVFEPNPDYQCRFCAAQGRCRALAGYELSIAREVFTSVEDDTELSDPNSLTRKEIGFLLDEFPGMRRWMTKVSTYALDLLENGERIPYWELKDKLGFREWDCEPDELEMYFDEDVLYERKLRSPAQVEKLEGKNSVNGLTKREVKGHTIAKSKDATDSEKPMIFDEVDDNG